jgi:two-component sensor histidine kinase
MARDIESLLRQQAALAAFGSFAFREHDLTKILNEAARICADSLGVSYCKICRYRSDQNDLRVEAGFGWNPGVVGLVVSRADQTSPQGRAFITGKPVLIRDLRGSNGFEPPPFYDEHGIVSTIDVLIKSEDGPPFGVLEVDSTTEHRYDQHDIDFLTGFANVLAEAVATSRRNETLRTTLTGMMALVNEKDRALEERDLLRMELQHRVRNNLQLISEMVNAQLRRTQDDPGRKGLQAIIRQIMTVAEVYEHLLGAGMNGQIDFGGYALGLCENLPDLQPSLDFPVELRCHAESLPVTLAAATSLGLVLTELISNSYEHAFPDRGGSISVLVKRGQSADQGMITITDDGIGYVPQPETKRQGVGLVRRLMKQVSGTIDVASGPGTVWTLSFPIIAAAPSAAPVSRGQQA